jgi:hypothetical protein
MAPMRPPLLHADVDRRHPASRGCAWDIVPAAGAPKAWRLSYWVVRRASEGSGSIPSLARRVSIQRVRNPNVKRSSPCRRQCDR